MKRTVHTIVLIALTFTYALAQNAPWISDLNCKERGTGEIDAVPGAKYCYTICTDDLDPKDTVKLSVEADPDLNASFDILNRGDSLERIRVCYTPGKTDYINSPYTYTVIATDRKGLTSRKSFVINVLEPPNVEIKSKVVGCGKVELSITEISNNVVQDYYINNKRYPKTGGKTQVFTLDGYNSGAQTITVMARVSYGFIGFYHTVFFEGGKVFNSNFIQEYQCVGLSTKLPVSKYSNSETTVQWSDGFERKDRVVFSVGDTTYKIRGENGSCTDILIINVDTVTFIARFGVSTKSSRAPAIVYFENKTSEPCDFFIWNFGDGHKSYKRNPAHLYTQPGTYTVTLRAEKTGMQKCRDTLIKERCIQILPTGIDALATKEWVSVYPTYSTGTVNIELETTEPSLAIIYDLQGRRVSEFPLTHGYNELSLEKFENGYYIINVSSGTKRLRKTLILNR